MIKRICDKCNKELSEKEGISTYSADSFGEIVPQYDFHDKCFAKIMGKKHEPIVKIGGIKE